MPPSQWLSAIMAARNTKNKTETKMKIITAILLLTVALGSTTSLQAGDKKKQKVPILCRIPLVKNTPLCSLYNKQQMERLAPRMPTYGGNR